MQYSEVATVQARLTYRLTSFLLENLAAEYTVEWVDASHAPRHAAETLGIADRELPWLVTRVDPRGYKSFGKRLSRKIVCGDCGRPFGHKTWHSGTSNRVDVWEFPTNYAKRGTCTTSHLYQELRLVKMAEALQLLAGRNSTAVNQAVGSLQSTGVRRRPSTLHTAIDKLLTESPTPACAPHPGLPCHAGGRLDAHRWQARIRVHHRRGRHPRPTATLEPRDTTR